MQETRHETECKGSALGVLAGLAVSVAVPFVAPALAGAIFGSSVMAGSLGWLASAGTGALLGGVGAALTGGNALTGALLGGVGSGVVQGLGAFGSTAQPVFGGATTGANAVSTPGLLGQFFPSSGAAAAPAVASATPGLAGVASAAPGVTALGASSSGAGAGALGASAAPAAAGLGAFQMPWDKITNAAIASSPALLGAAISDLTPPSDAALQGQQQAQQNLKDQESLYASAKNQLANIDPNYYAQNAANAARLRTATASQEGTRAAYGAGLNDPARLAAEQRRTAVAATGSAGQAYNDAYLTALDAQKGQTQVVAGLRPNYSDYASYIANYGVDAEQKQRAKDYAGYLSPFASAFLKSNTSQQAGTA